jgi:PAS domain S-box-containing protein
VSVPAELDAVDLLEALDPLSVPSYVIGRDGRLRWLNAAAKRMFGDLEGQEFETVVAPEYRERARAERARKLRGTMSSEYELEVIDAEGRRVVAEVNSVALKEDEHVLAIFGLLQPIRVAGTNERRGMLTPRQREVLRLLAEGASTTQIASELHVTRETVRNHIRAVLRALGAHSRLEAVAVARRQGLLGS